MYYLIFVIEKSIVVSATLDAEVFLGGTNDFFRSTIRIIFPTLVRDDFTGAANLLEDIRGDFNVRPVGSNSI